MINFKCCRCGHENYYIKEMKNGTGKAVGIYCSQCNRWVSWLSQKDKKMKEWVEGADAYIKLPEEQNSLPKESFVSSDLSSITLADKSAVQTVIEMIRAQLNLLESLLGKIETPSPSYPPLPYQPQPVWPSPVTSPGDVPNPYQITCESKLENKDDDIPPWE